MSQWGEASGSIKSSEFPANRDLMTLMTGAITSVRPYIIKVLILGIACNRPRWLPRTSSGEQAVDRYLSGIQQHIIQNSLLCFGLQTHIGSQEDLGRNRTTDLTLLGTLKAWLWQLWRAKAAKRRTIIRNELSLLFASYLQMKWPELSSDNRF